MKQGFDSRVVKYEDIHSIKPESFDLLLKIISPEPGEKILDAMCGYGSVSKLILNKEPDTEIHLADESKIQIDRATENLPNLPKDRFKVTQFPSQGYLGNSFDKIVNKMGLHESSLLIQQEVMNDFFRILRPGGLLVIWDIFLQKNTQKLFQDIIRKKDELSGYDMLVNERYFFREDEFRTIASDAGFVVIKKEGDIEYRFSSKKRLGPELPDEQSLEEFNNHIKDVFSGELKSKLDYSEDGDDIQFNVSKAIYSARKPD